MMKTPLRRLPLSRHGNVRQRRLLLPSHCRINMPVGFCRPAFLFQVMLGHPEASNCVFQSGEQIASKLYAFIFASRSYVEGLVFISTSYLLDGAFNCRFCSMA